MPQDTKGFKFGDAATVLRCRTVEEAIRVTVFNYMHGQLGWSIAACKERVAFESGRELPKERFDSLKRVGWSLKGARLLDVGAGQGAAILEALLRGADAFGVEPGDEFRALAQMRLSDAGEDPSRIAAAAGESLPFPSSIFDYVVSLYVMEHVPRPLRLMREMFRVLKPGGECYIACENYLSFREQHYRVPWLPMMPKLAGAFYLRLIGRDPSFLMSHVHYSTYPQIWRLARTVGFENLTYQPVLSRIHKPAYIRRRPVRMAVRGLQVLPRSAREKVVAGLLHLDAFWRVGVRVRLRKPFV